MKSLLALLGLCCLSFSFAQQEDPCLTYSYAPGVVYAIGNLSPSLFTKLATLSDVNVALNALYKIAVTSTSPFLQNIYVGSINEDYYMIKNCWTQQGPNEFCSSDRPQYLAYVRNTVIYTDEVRHVFEVVDGVVDVMDSATTLGTEPNPYNTTGRFWFNATNGADQWSELETYLSGGSGKTYSMAFGMGLVAAADKPMDEYCGPCLSDSYAVAVAQTLSITDFSEFVAITNSEDFTGVASLLQAVMSYINSPYTINGILGLPNGDSYMVQFCAELRALGAPECDLSDFNFYVTNQAVFGDISRRMFNLSSNGIVGNLISVEEPYNVTNRTWYEVGNGWSDAYTFASTPSIVGRTYSIAITGGVVGADRVEAEPCARLDSFHAKPSSHKKLAKSGKINI